MSKSSGDNRSTPPDDVDPCPGGRSGGSRRQSGIALETTFGSSSIATAQNSRQSNLEFDDHVTGVSSNTDQSGDSISSSRDPTTSMALPSSSSRERRSPSPYTYRQTRSNIGSATNPTSTAGALLQNTSQPSPSSSTNVTGGPTAPPGSNGSDFKRFNYAHSSNASNRTSSSHFDSSRTRPVLVSSLSADQNPEYTWKRRSEDSNLLLKPALTGRFPGSLIMPGSTVSNGSDVSASSAGPLRVQASINEREQLLKSINRHASFTNGTSKSSRSYGSSLADRMAAFDVESANKLRMRSPSPANVIAQSSVPSWNVAAPVDKVTPSILGEIDIASVTAPTKGALFVDTSTSALDDPGMTQLERPNPTRLLKHTSPAPYKRTSTTPDTCLASSETASVGDDDLATAQQWRNDITLRDLKNDFRSLHTGTTSVKLRRKFFNDTNDPENVEEDLVAPLTSPSQFAQSPASLVPKVHETTLKPFEDAPATLDRRMKSHKSGSSLFGTLKRKSNNKSTNVATDLSVPIPHESHKKKDGHGNRRLSSAFKESEIVTAGDSNGQAMVLEVFIRNAELLLLDPMTSCRQSAASKADLNQMLVANTINQMISLYNRPDEFGIQTPTKPSRTKHSSYASVSSPLVQMDAIPKNDIFVDSV